MHPVLRNILARRNKAVPVSDGRKICLVLFGGTMNGVRGAGTVVALKELGLTYAFDYIYSVSAGFANASYFITDQPHLGASIYYENLQKNYINFLFPWRLINTDHLLDVVMEDKKLDTRRALQAKTKLYVGLYNADLHKEECFEVHDFSPEEYYDLFRAAVSVQYLSPGAVKLGKYHYEDMPLSNGYHFGLIQKALNSDATDILVVYNYDGQVKKPKNFFQGDRLCEITPPRDWQFSRLETRPDKLKEECRKMGAYIKKLFGFEPKIELYERSSSLQLKERVLA